MTELALKTREVTKTYLVSGGTFRSLRKLKAVNGVSLNVTKGSVLGLVGESGCGKSSLAWALTRRGLGYFSDELAPIEVEGVRVLPFPRALRLKAAPPPPNASPTRIMSFPTNEK